MQRHWGRTQQGYWKSIEEPLCHTEQREGKGQGQGQRQGEGVGGEGREAMGAGQAGPVVVIALVFTLRVSHGRVGIAACPGRATWEYRFSIIPLAKSS